MWTKNFYYILIVILTLVSCKKNANFKSPTTVKINLNDTKSIVVDKNQIINLETTDSSLLFDICNLHVVDNHFIIHSRNSVKAFDRQGNYIRDIGSVGKANNEYTNVSNVFIDNDKIVIYDFGKQCLHSYGLDGTFYGNIPVIIQEAENTTYPNDIYKIGNSYVFVNSYGGEGRNVTALSLAENDMRTITPISGKVLTSGFFSPDDVCEYGDNLLYWQPLCDTLYIADNENMYPLYYFDFGKNAIPKDIAQKDFYDRMDYVNRIHAENKPFAGMIRYYASSDNLILFVCVAPNNEITLCKLNTENNEVESYRFDFEKKGLKLQPFLKLVNDTIFLSVIDKNNPTSNPGLIAIKANTII